MISSKADISVKLVSFCMAEDNLRILLINSLLPGGKYEEKETPDSTVKIIFEALTGISYSKAYFEQLYTFSYIKNKKPEIVITYFALVPHSLISSRLQKNFKDISDIGITKDSEIADYAISRLRGKVVYTNIIYSLLPDEFTFGQLQKTYEAVLGRKLDKRNFRKKIMSLRILNNTGKVQKQGRARPAEIYSFKTRKPSFVEIL